MPLLDRLRPEQRAELRRLHKKIANRVFGVELPIEAGTCGRRGWEYARIRPC